MTIPGRTPIIATLALALLLVGAIAEPQLLPVALIANVVVLAAAVLTGRALTRARVKVERERLLRAEIDQPADLVYRFENSSRRDVIMSVRQLWPNSFDAESNQLEISVAPGEYVRAGLSFTPTQRGRIRLPAAQIDVRFRSDWARRRWLLQGNDIVSVYPNLRATVQYDLLRRHRALSQFGIHRLRLIGTGREFDQLREYLPDDEYGDINWKATARRRTPITTVSQTERSQDVLLCLDCGRMMGNPVGTRTALDYAIDASIVLGHVCNRSGDRVGLALFRDTVLRFIKPVSGSAAIGRVMEEMVEIGAEPVFPSYAALIAAMRANQKRRSMVFLFTDLNDPQLAANLLEVIPVVSRRHVMIVVSLRDPLMDQIASGPAPDRRGLYQTLAARSLADERSARVGQLIQAGAHVLEADAKSITIDVINRYLEIKMRQLV